MSNIRHKPIFLILVVIPIPILIFVALHAYASESNSKRYSDGYANGGQQANTDFQNHKPFNLKCDPTGAYTSGGGHTKIYCSGWANGNTATWNTLALANPANNITSERYNKGVSDGTVQANNDFNNGSKYSNLSCGLSLPQLVLAYCEGHFDGYKNQFIKLQGAAATNPPATNPPTTNPPTTNQPSHHYVITANIIDVMIVVGC